MVEKAIHEPIKMLIVKAKEEEGARNPPMRAATAEPRSGEGGAASPYGRAAKRRGRSGEPV